MASTKSKNWLLAENRRISQPAATRVSAREGPAMPRSRGLLSAYFLIEPRAGKGPVSLRRALGNLQHQTRLRIRHAGEKPQLHQFRRGCLFTFQLLQGIV